MSIGDRIKQRRKELNLTQPQLAKIIGVSKGTIGNYESGLCAPNEKVLLKLFSALKCDANFLYQDNIKHADSKKITVKEAELLNKYRGLDDHGVRVVEFVLDEEYIRCKQDEAEDDTETFVKIKHSFYKGIGGKRL